MRPAEFEKLVVHESWKQDVVILFLRHFSCLFTLRILEKLAEFLQNDATLVKVYCIHPGSKIETQKILALLKNSPSVQVISDFRRSLYKHFKIKRASMFQFIHSLKEVPFSLSALIKTFQNFSIHKDIFQLPGAILVRKGKYLKHESSNFADIPPLEKLLCMSHANDI